MNWKQKLEDKGFVQQEFVPAVVEAADRDNRQALYLVSRILLDLCEQGHQGPLEVLYTPEAVLGKLGIDNEAVKVVRRWNGLLQPKRIPVIRSVINDKAKENGCRVSSCNGFPCNNTVTDCRLPTVYLWKLLLDLTEQDSIKAADLNPVLRVLENPYRICGSNWWQGSNNRSRTRERYWFIFAFLKEMREHINGDYETFIPEGTFERINNKLDLSSEIGPSNQEVALKSGGEGGNDDIIDVFFALQGKLITTEDYRENARERTKQATMPARGIFHFLLDRIYEK